MHRRLPLIGRVPARMSPRLGVALLSLLLVFMTLGTASQSAEASSHSASPSVIIPLLIPTASDPTWSQFALHLQRRLTKVDPNANLVVLSAHSRLATQLTQARQAIDGGAKLLLICPVDPTRTARVVSYAHAHGTKVIAIGRPIDNPRLNLFIGFNPFVAGELQGSFLLHTMRSGRPVAGNLLLINGPATDVIAKAEYEGFDGSAYDPRLIKAIDAGRFDIALPTWNSWSRSASRRSTTEGVFKTDKHIAAVVAQSDVLAAGALNVLSLTRPQALHPVVTGAGSGLLGLRNILAGGQSMTAFEPATLEAVVTDAAISDVLAGTPLSTVYSHRFRLQIGRVPAVLLRPISVTASAIQRRVIRAGYIGKASIDGQMTVSDLCAGLKSACRRYHIH